MQMNYFSILRMTLFQNLCCRGIYYIYYTVSDPYFLHFGILTKRKIPANHHCSQNDTSIL